MNARADEQSHEFDAVLSRAGTASLKWERYRGTDVLPFWVADMDFAAAAPIRRALETRLAHPVYGYTVAPDGLAEAVIAHLGTEYGWRVEPDWFVWLPGVVPGLAASCRAFCGSGEEVIVNPPIYHHFFDAHEEARQRLVKVPLHRVGERWTYDVEAMREACTERTRLLMMCSPHNPTGTVFTADELRAVAALCAERDVVMVSDEIHCDLVLDERARHRPIAVACPERAHRLITLMSASKTWNLAGLNCSFAVIEEETLRSRFRAACVSSVSSVPSLAFEAARAAYAEGGAWRRRLLDYLRGNLALVGERVAAMPGLRLEPLQATYLAWIDASALGLEDPRGWFERHGVGLSGGEQFGQPGHLRLNFACPRATLVEGLDRMAEAIRILQPRLRAPSIDAKLDDRRRDASAPRQSHESSRGTSMADEKDKPAEGDTYECEICGMDILVTSDCNCQTDDGAFFACCGKQMTKTVAAS